jgi:hypothetical protein
VTDLSKLDFTDAPSVLIFADRPEDRAIAADVAIAVGARIIGVERIVDAMERLERQVTVDALLIELTEEGGGEVDWLLGWANAACRDGDVAIIIAFPVAMIDRVMAAIDEPRVVLLCEPGLTERAGALGLALAGRRDVLHDHGIESDAERLRRLSEEVARIAGALSDMSSAARSLAEVPLQPLGGMIEAARLAPQTVRQMIRLRRLRGQFFPDELFADPAWDMMLDLTAARLEGIPVAVSSLCIAAAVPPTTALRWIRTLTEKGLFVRRADPGDGRRIFIQLSDSAAAAMGAYFAQAQALGWRPDTRRALPARS